MFLVGLGGSLREASRSRAALQTALSIAEESGCETKLLDVRALDLPFFRPGAKLADYAEAEQERVAELVEACREADAMLWASPTYHGTVTGVVKNAIDYIELLRDDERPYLSKRAVGLISANDQVTFGAMANSVLELRAWLAPTQVVVNRSHFDADLTLTDERVKRRLGRIVEELIEFTASNPPIPMPG